MSDGELEAFEILGEESRIDVFLALVEARHERWDVSDFVEACENPPVDIGPTLSYSELMDLAGFEDSGRFNYHLGKLRGTFLTKDEEGYRLTRAGVEVANVVAGGWHLDAPEREETGIGPPCPICDSPVTAAYGAGEFSVFCENEHSLVVDSFPSGIARGDSLETIRRKQTRRSLNELSAVIDGVCPACSATLDPTIASVRFRGEIALFGDACDSCGTAFASNLRTVPLADPRVRAFYTDHGRPFPETPIWGVDLFDDDRWRDAPEEGIERFETVHEGERLVVTVTDSGIGRVARGAVGSR